MKSLLTTWESPQHGTLTIHYNWLRTSKEQLKVARASVQSMANKRNREMRKRIKESNDPWPYVREDEG